MQPPKTPPDSCRKRERRHSSPPTPDYEEAAKALRRMSINDDTPSSSPMSTSVATLIDDFSVPPTPSSPPTEECANDKASSSGDVFLDSPSIPLSVLVTSRPLRLMGAASEPARLESMISESDEVPAADCYAPGTNSQAAGPVANGTRPRGQSDDITPDNAQARLPPDACLFVANLPSGSTDDKICRALEMLFSQLGECYIKIKRDRGMPIAFVQFRYSWIALRALKDYQGRSVLGRGCRIERARAHRTVYISRRDGQQPNEHEVRAALAECGELQKVWEASDSEKACLSLHPGLFVKFLYYQDSLECINKLRFNPAYHVDPLKNNTLNGQLGWVFDRDTIMLAPHGGSTLPFFQHGRDDDSALFVGGLPPTVSKAELSFVFGGHGCEIRRIELKVLGLSARGPNNMGYAIIYFRDRTAAVNSALKTHNQLRISGRYARIEFAKRQASFRNLDALYRRSGTLPLAVGQYAPNANNPQQFNPGHISYYSASNVFGPNGFDGRIYTPGIFGPEPYGMATGLGVNTHNTMSTSPVSQPRIISAVSSSGRSRAHHANATPNWSLGNDTSANFIPQSSSSTVPGNSYAPIVASTSLASHYEMPIPFVRR